MAGVIIDQGEIALEVNGATKQKSDVDKLIWNVREIIADLSLFYHLQPGDLIYTGTPEGVGAVVPSDKITGHVAGVGDVALTVGQAE
jgi:fumarylpyruvate hydrolase